MTVLRALFPLAAAASEYRDKALSKLMGEHNPRSQLISILLRHLRCLAQWQELRPRGFRTFLAPTITGFLSFILPSGSADTANSFWLLTIGDMRLSGRIFRFIGQCLECSAYDPRYPTCDCAVYRWPVVFAFSLCCRDTVAMEPSLVFEKCERLFSCVCVAFHLEHRKQCDEIQAQMHDIFKPQVLCNLWCCQFRCSCSLPLA